MNVRAQHYARDLRRYYRLPATQVSLTVVLSLLVVAIFVTFALRPTLTTIFSLQKTIKDSEKTLEQLEVKTANLQQAANQWEIVKLKTDILNKSITNQNAGYYPFISQLEALASATGVQLQTENLGSTLLFSRIVTPFAAKKGQGVVAMPVVIKVTGTYPGLRDFLTRLTSMERLIGVESLMIGRESNSQKDVTPQVSLTINGSIYYLADTQTLNPLLEEKRRAK